MIATLNRLDRWFEGVMSTRASLENPQTSLSAPDAWLYEAFGAKQASSGVMVSRETSLTYPAVWAAVNLLSSDIAGLPLVTYKRIDGGGKERDQRHPAYNILLHEPNGEQTAFDFIKQLTGHVVLCRNGYAYIERDTNMRPLRLLPLLPETITVERRNGLLVYMYQYQGVTRPIDPINMLHIKGVSHDGLAGIDMIDKARDSMGLGLGAAQYAAKFFANNAKPPIIIEHPAKWSVEGQQEFLRQWNSLAAGLSNAHKAAILTGGATLKEYGNTARESQLSEVRQAEVRDMANWFTMPPHLLTDPTRVSYASLEQENQSYLQRSLNPWLRSWETQCRAKLLTADEKAADSHVIEFKREALTSTDTATLTSSLVEQVNNGLLTLNEARAILNLPPLPNGEGDKYRIPANIGILGEEPEPAPQPAAQPADEEPPEPPEQEDDARMDRIREAALKQLDAARRLMLTRLRKSASRCKDRYELEAWRLKMREATGHGTVVWEAIHTACQSLAAVDGYDSVGLSNQLVDEFFTRADHWLARWAEHDGTMAAAIRSAFDYLDEPSAWQDWIPTE